MSECLLCGGSRLREYRYGCEHVMLGEDAPEPLIVDTFTGSRGELLWLAGGPIGTDCVSHPTREGAIARWQERWRWGRFVDALFSTLTRWAREGEAMVDADAEELGRELGRLSQDPVAIEALAEQAPRGWASSIVKYEPVEGHPSSGDVVVAVVGGLASLFVATCVSRDHAGRYVVSGDGRCVTAKDWARSPNGDWMANEARPATPQGSPHAWRRYFLRDDLATMQRDREWAREEIAEYLGTLGAVSHDTSEAIMIKLSEGGIRVDGVRALFGGGDRVSTLTLLRDCDGVWRVRP